MTLRGVAPLLATALGWCLAGCSEAPPEETPAALYGALLEDAIGHGLPGSR